LESNDQVLSINGSYFDDKSRYSLLSKLNRVNSKRPETSTSSTVESLFLPSNQHNVQNNNNNNSSGNSITHKNNTQKSGESELARLSLLISRNVNKQLVRKNLKKPNIVAGENLLLRSDSPSTSSLLSISSINSAISVNTRNLFGKRPPPLTNTYSTTTQQQGYSNSSLHNYNQLLLYNTCNGQLEIGAIAGNETTSRPRSESISHRRSSSVNNSTNNGSSILNNVKSTTPTTGYPLFCHMTHRNDKMVLNTQWTQVELIELLNESLSWSNAAAANAAGAGGGAATATTGASSLNSSAKNFLSSSAVAGALSGSNSGFGFGITGNKSTGVVIKAITPGGSACKVGAHMIFTRFTPIHTTFHFEVNRFNQNISYLTSVWFIRKDSFITRILYFPVELTNEISKKFKINLFIQTHNFIVQLYDLIL
jgi:hypothetical protein